MSINPSVLDNVKIFNKQDGISISPSVRISHFYADVFHSGIIFLQNFETSEDVYMHLTYEELQTTSDLKNGFHYVKINTKNELMDTQINSICKLVLQNNPTGIPYGCSFPVDCFDGVNFCFNSEVKSGLTCSSFILAILHLSGFDIVDYSSWPVNDEETVQYYEEYIDLAPDLPKGISSERIDLLLGEILKSVRFKPSHVVVAAANGNDPPLDFDTADALGEILEQHLKSRF